MPTGKVKWFNPEKGFGFLAREDGPDVFVHKDALPAGTSELKPGQRVEFGIVAGRRGDQALQVRVLDPLPSVSATVAAAPGTRITFTVPASVATHGWTVQVYDQQLEERIGQAPVPAGQRSFDQITMSDPAPSAFYLVVVEKETAACHELAGSWPAGFIRVQTGSGSASASVSQAG